MYVRTSFLRVLITLLMIFILVCWMIALSQPVHSTGWGSRFVGETAQALSQTATYGAEQFHIQLTAIRLQFDGRAPATPQR